ncbi:hypothetical protein GCM10007886_39290 [Methylobacterium gregans]|nr:hypothetical protein GCM10007886_39290 [Methylobacterium gregans]
MLGGQRAGTDGGLRRQGLAGRQRCGFDAFVHHLSFPVRGGAPPGALGAAGGGTSDDAAIVSTGLSI